MKRNLIIAAILLLVLAGMYMLWQQQTRYDWKETYADDTHDPYALAILQNLLKTSTDAFQIIDESLAEQLPEGTGANYVFAGAGMYMDSLDTETLLDFVERGNTAFISSKVVPHDLMFYAVDSFCNELWWDEYSYIGADTMLMNFSHPNLRHSEDFQYTYLQPKSKMKRYYWQFLSNGYFCEQENSPAALGYMQDSLINFLRFDYGNGAFYLHATPLVFTNIFLKEKEGLHYANRAFSHLSDGPIYWDKYSRVPEQIARRMNNSSPPPNRQLSEDSPLRYVLSQPPLAWAWYLTLALGLLYLIFRAKRQQRVIPVLEKNENTSLTFVKNIGRLYFLQQNHRQLALQKMRLFLADVRDRYHLNTSQLDADFVEKLHARTGVATATIEKLLLMHRNIKSSSFTSENVLIELHRLMEQFKEIDDK